MPEEPDWEARVTALETRVDQIAAKAEDARHLAAFVDRDIVDLAAQVNANSRGLGDLTSKVDSLAIKVDANGQAINALGQQTAAQLADLRSGQAELRTGQAELRGGVSYIITLLDRLIDPGGNGTSGLAET